MSKIQELKSKIDSLQQQIDNIQSECNHPLSARTQVNGGSTGNYDPTADCYWTDNTCGLCEKRWTEDQ
jgi:hypothetical protein